MIDREPEVPDERRIMLRIGINLGDVIAEKDDIFGDGVNIAARLEGLAEPGAVLISHTVHDHVRDRLSFTFEDWANRVSRTSPGPCGVCVEVRSGRRVAVIERNACRVNLPACRRTAPVDCSCRSPILAVTPSRGISPTELPRTSRPIFLGSRGCS
jgi:hypothetical protein